MFIISAAALTLLYVFRPRSSCCPLPSSLFSVLQDFGIPTVVYVASKRRLAPGVETLQVKQGMVDGSASKSALRKDTGYKVEKTYHDL